MQSQVQQGSFQRRFRRRFLEALVQSQVRFNKVPEKVLEKVWEALVQNHIRFNRICGHLIHGNPAEVFPALGFAARFRKNCNNKTLRLLLGIPPKLISILNTRYLLCIYQVFTRYRSSDPLMFASFASFARRSGGILSLRGCLGPCLCLGGC